MSDHTPGPWFELKRSTSYIDIVGGSQASDEIPELEKGGTFCTSVCRVHIHAPCEANANLISAAPDLLDACSKWIEWMDSPGDGTEKDAADEDLMLEEMRTAISKAKGESL